MSELKFKFAEFSQEIKSMQKLARKHIDTRRGWDVFGQLRSDLDNIRICAEGRKYKWGISPKNPLTTKPSSCYLRKVPFPVYAEITSIWEIEPIGRSRKPKPTFRLVGIASTSIQLFQEINNAAPRKVGLWRMEIGDSLSPGCHFHVQIEGQTDTVPFPKNVPVPRLPGYIATPLSALGFVLGELFQEEWAKEMSRDRDELSMWRGIQKERFDRLFKWQRETVQDTRLCPWVALKKMKPPETLFSR